MGFHGLFLVRIMTSDLWKCALVMNINAVAAEGLAWLSDISWGIDVQSQVMCIYWPWKCEKSKSISQIFFCKIRNVPHGDIYEFGFINALPWSHLSIKMLSYQCGNSHYDPPIFIMEIFMYEYIILILSLILVWYSKGILQQAISMSLWNVFFACDSSLFEFQEWKNDMYIPIHWSLLIICEQCITVGWFHWELTENTWVCLLLIAEIINSSTLKLH